MEIVMLRNKIRILLSFFMVGLVLSGITAIPLIPEVNLLSNLMGKGTLIELRWPEMSDWISYLQQGLTETQQNYPFIAYGTDWLAFAHIVIAIAFWGPFRDPVKNLWVIEFGMLACVLTIPMVLIFAPMRGIPYFWQAIDCSFGLIGILPLWLARKYTVRMVAIEGTLQAGSPA